MKDLEKEFVPYQPSLDMKELGFDEPCFAIWSGIDELNFSITDTIRLYSSEFSINGTQSSKFYVNDFNSLRVAAPTFSQALRWFSEKQEIEGFVHKSIEGNYYFVIKRIGNNESNMYEFTKTSPKTFDTYEEAELECLKKLIEIVKNK
jgi:hypothetical protein